MSNFVILALGSNVGDKLKNIQQSLIELNKNKIEIIKCSNIYQSEAILPENAPNEWNLDFYNCVTTVTTDLELIELFNTTKEIEYLINENAEKREFWSPRKIDIDILAFNKDVVDTLELKIPHARMFERDFVILPLNEIDPQWKCPKKGEYYGKTASEISKKFKKTKISRTEINPLI